MNAKQFLKEKGISNDDFMDSGVADLIETLLTEYQALQLQQTGVMARCFEDYIGKKFIYKSKITRHNTIFKVIAQFERCGKTVLVSENNNKYYLHEVADSRP